jgi:DNA polymerase III delta subunit
LKIPSFEVFEEKLSAAGAGSAFLLCGTEPYQAGRIRSAVITRFVEGCRFDRVQLGPDEVKPGDLRRMAGERSLFAPGLLIRIADADKAPAAVRTEIAEAAESIGENAILVETSETSIRTGLNARLDRCSLTYICWEPFDRDLPRWCSRLCMESGMDASREVQSMLVSWAAGSLERLAEAVERTALFTLGRKAAREDVAGVLSSGGRAGIFDLADLVQAGDRKAALVTAWSLASEGEEPVGMVAFLFRQWQRSVQARAILASGGSAEAVERSLGLPKSVSQRIVRLLAGSPGPDPAEAAEAFAAADNALKTGGDPYIALAELVQSLTRTRKVC